jgi:uncharacterized protein YbaR (Trm112 family)
MKKEIMEILACPVCKGSLDLSIVEEDGREVITGSLSCPRCRAVYAIKDAIPDLLPPDRHGVKAAQ